MSALPAPRIEHCPVALGLEPADVDEAIAVVAGQWRGIPALADVTNELVAAIQHREKVASTALPCGIAIPHARSAHVHGVIGAVGRLSQPVAFGDTSVWLVVALVTDPANPRAHLEALGSLARRASDADVLEKMRVATTADSLREALFGA